MNRLIVLSAFLILFGFGTADSAQAQSGDEALKKGNALVQAGKLDEALSLYQQASQDNPKNAKLHLLLGLTLAQKGDSAEAAKHLRSAIQIEPTFQAWYSLGLIYANSSAFTKAVDAYQEALKINPDAYKTWYQLGLVHAAELRFDKALEAYNKSILLNPQFEEGYLGLGSAYFWSGDKESARKQVGRMKLLKMNTKAAALEEWLNKKDAARTNPTKAPETQVGKTA